MAAKVFGYLKGTNSAVSTRGIVHRKKGERPESFWRKRRWWLLGGAVSVVVLVLVGINVINSRPVYVKAPEAAKIIAAQQDLKFGILIPTYMPGGFDRENMELKVSPSGPSGEALADLTYRNLGQKAAIYLRQWVPGNPELETLRLSVPVMTNWGKGWLLTQGGKEGIGTIWVDIGQLRASVSSSNLKIVTPEQLVQIANTLGLASEEQVYTFNMEPITIRGVAPPPPFEVPLTAEGIQELNLTITPGGYSPARFAVKKDIPVKINFRAMGEVGCGNEGFIRMPDGNNIGLHVSQSNPLYITEFTASVAGDFPFGCSHNTFRGIMTVRE